MICRDKETEPRLTEVSPGHLVACHFPFQELRTAPVDGGSWRAVLAPTTEQPTPTALH